MKAIRFSLSALLIAAACNSNSNDLADARVAPVDSSRAIDAASVDGGHVDAGVADAISIDATPDATPDAVQTGTVDVTVYDFGESGVIAVGAELIVTNADGSQSEAFTDDAGHAIVSVTGEGSLAVVLDPSAQRVTAFVLGGVTPGQTIVLSSPTAPAQQLSTIHLALSNLNPGSDVTLWGGCGMGFFTSDAATSMQDLNVDVHCSPGPLDLIAQFTDENGVAVYQALSNVTVVDGMTYQLPSTRTPFETESFTVNGLPVDAASISLQYTELDDGNPLNNNGFASPAPMATESLPVAAPQTPNCQAKFSVGVQGIADSQAPNQSLTVTTPVAATEVLSWSDAELPTIDTQLAFDAGSQTYAWSQSGGHPEAVSFVQFNFEYTSMDSRVVSVFGLTPSSGTTLSTPSFPADLAGLSFASDNGDNPSIVLWATNASYAHVLQTANYFGGPTTPMPGTVVRVSSKSRF